MADQPNELTLERSADAVSSSQISDMIEKLLSNPELISTVASALGKTPPTAENVRENSAEKSVSDTDTPKDAQIGELMSGIAPVLARLKAGDKGTADTKGDRRVCLLSALKPYLCKERCDAIDYIIRLGKISELFKNMS